MSGLPGLPPVQYADVDGLKMAYYEVGPRGQGVPTIFCHGFPELAYSWRHQLKAFEAAGRWAIAPDQRGYGLTAGPQSIEDYDMKHLTGDLIGLLDHLSAPKAIWCGHDWGGAVVWQMPLRHPDRTSGVIGLNTPFTPRAPVDPIAVLRARFGEDMYMVHFQTPGDADAVLAKDVAKTMNFFMRRPLAGDPASGGLSGRGEGGQTFALVKQVDGYDASVDLRESFLTAEELQVFIETFSRTGFTGGINWYRNISRNWTAAQGLPEKVLVPSLMIMAERDAVLPPSAADSMGDYVLDLEKALVPGSGHWTQQEEPEQTNRILLSWLEKRFPKGTPTL